MAIGRCKSLARVCALVAFSAVTSMWSTVPGSARAVHVLVPSRINDDRLPVKGRFKAHELERLWWDMAAEPFTACQAMNKLLTAPERLVPAIAVNRGRLKKLAAELESKDMQVRQRVAAVLVHYGELAGPALRETLDNLRPLDTRPAVEAVLEIITEQPRLAEIQRVLRAVEVLERLGTRRARQVLHRLAAGAPGHALTCEAQAALIRLGKR